ncbi:hypothetical protein [Kineosporia succinea]|uniref:Uncharacterized protein n=1 Tax=Kineosporia succinea TaxID=84632 RepID=A0ABT9PD46_9ACTN|nr:hypothetical protein [Kineosporia succinea]MDP9830622.1 hypothetical protein [Kineosporia succinea]
MYAASPARAEPIHRAAPDDPTGTPTAATNSAGSASAPTLIRARSLRGHPADPPDPAPR